LLESYFVKLDCVTIIICKVVLDVRSTAVTSLRIKITNFSGKGETMLKSISTLTLAFLILIGTHSFTAAADPISLPQPQLDASKSLVQALKDRKTTREYAAGEVSKQVLSNLLWSAWGINRADGKRTAPSAWNKQEISIYVTLAEGAFLYDAKANDLVPVAAEDIRALTGTQSYFKDAAINLVYVADLAKMAEGEEASKMFLAAADTGFIAENVYLYCASEGLATVFRAQMDKEKLGKALKLGPEHRIIFAQTVGMPKK
jgi:nitroreductase